MSVFGSRILNVQVLTELASAMARSKHNKAAQKPIKPAQTTSKKKTLKKQIKTEGTCLAGNACYAGS